MLTLTLSIRVSWSILSWMASVALHCCPTGLFINELLHWFVVQATWWVCGARLGVEGWILTVVLFCCHFHSRNMQFWGIYRLKRAMHTRITRYLAYFRKNMQFLSVTVLLCSLSRELWVWFIPKQYSPSWKEWGTAVKHSIFVSKRGLKWALLFLFYHFKVVYENSVWKYLEFTFQMGCLGFIERHIF